MLNDLISVNQYFPSNQSCSVCLLDVSTVNSTHTDIALSTTVLLSTLLEPNNDNRRYYSLICIFYTDLWGSEIDSSASMALGLHFCYSVPIRLKPIVLFTLRILSVICQLIQRSLAVGFKSTVHHLWTLMRHLSETTDWGSMRDGLLIAEHRCRISGALERSYLCLGPTVS